MAHAVSPTNSDKNTPATDAPASLEPPAFLKSATWLFKFSFCIPRIKEFPKAFPAGIC